MALVQYAPGSHATGSGSGGGGGRDPSKPVQLPSGHETYDLNWLLDLIMNKVILDLANLRRIRRAALINANNKSLPPSLRAPDALLFYNEDESDLKPIHEPNQRSPTHAFNLKSKSNVNYFISGMMQAARGRTVHTGANQCRRCRNGSGPWHDCVTLTHNGHKFLKGACTNCGYGNHFGLCDFADVEPPQTPGSPASSDVVMWSPSGRHASPQVVITPPVLPSAWENPAPTENAFGQPISRVAELPRINHGLARTSQVIINFDHDSNPENFDLVVYRALMEVLERMTDAKGLPGNTKKKRFDK